MEPRVLLCPRCGGTLPRRAALVRMSCPYCGAEVSFERFTVKAADYRAALARKATTSAAFATASVAGVPIAVRGRLAVGHISDVLLAETTARLSERWVIHVLRHDSDAALLERSLAAVRALREADEPGADHFSTLLPQLVSRGSYTSGAGSWTHAAVFRESIGFSHTLADLERSFPAGLDPRHLVWLGRRVLGLLAFVHASGWVHGAVLPAHVLVNASEHAAQLVGWSSAVRIGEQPHHVSNLPHERALYPSELGAMTPVTDLAMLAGCLLRAGASGRGRAAMPAPLVRWLDALVAGAGPRTAADAQRELKEVGIQCFGKPAFVKLELP